MCEEQVADLEKSIRRRFTYHLRRLGYLTGGDYGVMPPSEEKHILRSMQSKRRSELLRGKRGFIKTHYPELKGYFASGSDIKVEDIKPHLALVKSGTEFSNLFRLASLTWGVPVSDGYGRRLRFLVLDKSNGKLMGLIGLADPVFNLRARDDAIGWTQRDRQERLVNVMNAYILGALPPYNMLLGGKLVSCLVRTREVRDTFLERYHDARGIISGEMKKPRLAMVTTTSSLGRSTIYDRLRLKHKDARLVPYFTSVGYTLGWGHFHLPNSLFRDMRLYLELKEHPYANGHKYGNGSNWRLRASQKALSLLGLNTNLMNHGVKREVFLCRLAENADAVLRGHARKLIYSDLLSVKSVGSLAVDRWMVGRSERRKEYLTWRSEDILDMLDPRLNGLSSLQVVSDPVTSMRRYPNKPHFDKTSVRPSFGTAQLVKFGELGINEDEEMSGAMEQHLKKK